MNLLEGLHSPAAVDVDYLQQSVFGIGVSCCNSTCGLHLLTYRHALPLVCNVLLQQSLLIMLGTSVNVFGRTSHAHVIMALHVCINVPRSQQCCTIQSALAKGPDQQSGHNP
jgi:hypothetical protein